MIGFGHGGIFHKFAVILEECFTSLRLFDAEINYMSTS